jgi:hypothetical protein
MDRSINETGVAILLFFIIIIGSIAVSNYMQKARENSETSIQKQSEPSKPSKPIPVLGGYHFEWESGWIRIVVTVTNIGGEGPIRVIASAYSPYTGYEVDERTYHFKPYETQTFYLRLPKHVRLDSIRIEAEVPKD